MKDLFKFFYFNKKERRALVLFLALITFGLVYKEYSKQEVAYPNYSQELAFENWQNFKSHIENESKVSADKSEKSIRYTKPVDHTVYLNINTVDSFQLMQLPGIGKVYASRIVRYRDLLGGFYSTSQILEVYGIDSLRYVGFQDMVFVRGTTLKKVHINTCREEELKRHPYISWKLARTIIRNRKHKGPFIDFDRIKSMPLIDEHLFRKIAPYLDLE